MTLRRCSPSIAVVVLAIACLGCGKESSPTKPQAPGSIAVASTPEGAAIRLDGATTGTVTPDTLTAVSAGTHEIRLSFANYEDWAGSVSVPAGQLAYVDAVLAGSVGSISVESTPPGASISLNGSDSGLRTPAILSGVPVGAAVVTVRGEVCDWSSSVTVTRNQSTAVAAVLYVLQAVYDPGFTGQPYYTQLDLDASGNIYVAEYTAQRVTKLSPSGVVLARWSTTHYPGGIAVASNGDVYTLGYDPGVNGATVIRFDPTGVPLGSWGGRGTGNGQFSIADIYPIAVDAARNVYVLDNANLRIQRFDANGNFLTKWTVNYRLGSTLHYSGIAVDAAGYVWVAGVTTAGGGTWDKWTPNGVLVEQVPEDSPGAPGQDLYVDGAGFFYTPIGSWPRPVARFSPSGQIEHSFAVRGDILTVWGVVGDAAGRIFVTGRSSSTGRDKVAVFSLAN